MFNKLGITDFEWQMLPNDVVLASGELKLRPRDMAKFGLLFLNHGLWASEQIISKEWIDESTRKQIPLNNYGWNWGDGYGYQWWHWFVSSHGRNFNAVMAIGWGQQWIVQIHELEVVIVLTAGNYDLREIISHQTIVENYIITSIL